MRHTALLLAASMLAGLAVETAQAQLLVYNFSSSSAGPTSANASLTGSAVVTGGGVTTTSNTSPVSSGYSGASGGYFITDNGWTGTSPGTNYFQFTITPLEVSITITSISFGYRESGSSTGPTNFTIRSSADAYASNLASGALTNSNNAWHNSGTTSLTLSFSSATTIRIYATGAASNTPTLRLDDLTLNGSVSAVPEPAITGLGAGLLALGAVLAVRRRRHAS